MKPLVKVAIGGALAAGAVALLPAWNNRRWSRSPDATGGDPLGLPASRERTVTSVDGTELAVFELGGTDPTLPLVVLPHCWTGDHRIWAPVVRRLLPDHRVVLYDQRGHGRSTVGAAGLSVRALADDLAAVLDAVDALDVVVAGHSMGGMTLQAYAIEHPDDAIRRVRHMVLVATACQNATPLARFSSPIDRTLSHSRLTSAMASDRLAAGLVRGVFGKQPSLPQMRATAATFAATDGRVRADMLAVLAAMDLTAGLPSIPLPATILVGSRDTLTPPARARQMNRLLRDSTLEVLPGSGHMLPLEAPDEVAAAIRRATAATPEASPDPAPVASASPAST